MNKKLLISIGVGVIVAGGVFFGGMKFAQGRPGIISVQAFQKMSANQRRQTLQQLGIAGGAGGGAGAQGGTGRGFRQGGAAAGGGFVAGQVISKDDKSITIKTSDG